MFPPKDEIQIGGRDLWFKVVDMLQQNWALVDQAPDGDAVVWFVGDDSGVFDEMRFESVDHATGGLARNGFRRLALDPEAQDILDAPVPPYFRGEHPSGRIYSEGRYWEGDTP